MFLFLIFFPPILWFDDRICRCDPIFIVTKCDKILVCCSVWFTDYYFYYNIPGTPWCCNIILLRDRCCSSLCTAAVNWAFSTYKSFTSKSELVRRCACSLIIITCVSTVPRSSLISLRCCCHDSVTRIAIDFVSFHFIYYGLFLN